MGRGGGGRGIGKGWGWEGGGVTTCMGGGSIGKGEVGSGIRKGWGGRGIGKGWGWEGVGVEGGSGMGRAGRGGGGWELTSGNISTSGSFARSIFLNCVSWKSLYCIANHVFKVGL